MTVRVPALDALEAKGMRVVYYDPDGTRFGLPTYPYRWAPQGLLTRRQLTASGLRPGGQCVAAQIIWKHKGKRRIAYLYRADAAKPKRTASPSQLKAIESALRARRTCPTCGTEKDYYISLSLGECNDCAARWGR
jgi:rubredoxin